MGQNLMPPRLSLTLLPVQTSAAALPNPHLLVIVTSCPFQGQGEAWVRYTHTGVQTLAGTQLGGMVVSRQNCFSCLPLIPWSSPCPPSEQESSLANAGAGPD